VVPDRATLMTRSDDEQNRLSARAARYMRVGLQVGGVAARMAGARMTGTGFGEQANAVMLTQALGGLKGPLMKVAQLVATIPDLLPPDFAQELQKLQSDAPPMGAAFVKRRMIAELGPDWLTRFAQFDLKPSAAASLGQVHKATSLAGDPLACKLQYPDMQSAVEADLNQLSVLFAMHRQMDPAIDTSEIAKEIAERIREELDYEREAKHADLYRLMLAGEALVRVPNVHQDLSTDRLLVLNWLEGKPLLGFKQHDLATRNRIATAMFQAWWLPFSRFGVIHGDPHLGNYPVFEEGAEAGGINLLDYGCVRIFPPRFVGGVVDLYRGLRENDLERVTHAYQTWGFKGLTKELIEVLNVWARFIYAPLLDDRVRTVADGVSPAAYGRKEAFTVHQALKKQGPVTIPQEFVFMDRAAIGLGSVFLHLSAELNFHQLFETAMADFSVEGVTARQSQALQATGLIPA
jgi:predicted unusual protein kinase regulating ubiquinone biosynthesis (AarF/ABC1/UbiB family)